MNTPQPLHIVPEHPDQHAAKQEMPVKTSTALGSINSPCAVDAITTAIQPLVDMAYDNRDVVALDKINALLANLALERDIAYAAMAKLSRQRLADLRQKDLEGKLNNQFGPGSYPIIIQR